MGAENAVEALARDIITQFHSKWEAHGKDDSAFALDLKTILDGVQAFLTQSPKSVDDPARLTGDLYEFGKSLWQKTWDPKNAPKNKADPATETDPDYLDFYFEHLFSKGNWPP